MDLELAVQKRFSVTHTEERRAELRECLGNIIQAGAISPKEAEGVRGRMLFFECFVFGRVANLDLKLFGDLCRMGRVTNILTIDEFRIVVTFLIV